MWKLPPPQTVTAKLGESPHHKIQVRNIFKKQHSKQKHIFCVVAGLKRASRQTASEWIRSRRVQIKLVAEQIRHSSATLSQHISDESDSEAERKPDYQTSNSLINPDWSRPEDQRVNLLSNDPLLANVKDSSSSDWTCLLLHDGLRVQTGNKPGSPTQ